MRCIYQVELMPTGEQAQALRDTMIRFAHACQYVKMCAEEAEEYSQSKLQQLLYIKLREKFGLGAQVAVLAIKVIADTHRIAKSLPDFNNVDCMIYDQRTCRFVNELIVSLWTLQGRKLIPYQRVVQNSTEKLQENRGGSTDLRGNTGEVATIQPAEQTTTEADDPEDIRRLIPFACEEIELCSQGNKLLLNMVYSRRVLDHFAQTYRAPVEK